MKKPNENIANMQKKLKLLRQVFGVNTVEFADMIGVTRQTIYNIESEKTVLGKTQYLAICQVFNLMIKQDPQKYQILKSVWESGFDTQAEEVFDGGFENKK